jgi:hypothetical protein
LKYYVGCSGWTYSSWTEFYPRTLHLDDYLAYYSRVFNFVEIDLDNLDQQQRQQQQQEEKKDGCGNYTHDLKNSANDVINYHSSVVLPDRKIIKKWSEVTPSDFRFSLKLPIALTNKIDRVGNFGEDSFNKDSSVYPNFKGRQTMAGRAIRYLYLSRLLSGSRV